MGMTHETLNRFLMVALFAGCGALLAVQSLQNSLSFGHLYSQFRDVEFEVSQVRYDFARLIDRRAERSEDRNH